jgi:hypothetical protein
MLLKLVVALLFAVPDSHTFEKQNSYVCFIKLELETSSMLQIQFYVSQIRDLAPVTVSPAYAEPVSSRFLLFVLSFEVFREISKQKVSWRTTALSWRGGLRDPVTRRAMLAGA